MCGMIANLCFTPPEKGAVIEVTYGIDRHAMIPQIQNHNSVGVGVGVMTSRPIS